MTMTSIAFCRFQYRSQINAVYVRVHSPRLPTSLMSRRPIPAVAVTQVVPHEEATSHLRPTLGDPGDMRTRGNGWGSSPATKFPLAQISSLPPCEKKSLHLAARLLRSCYSRETSHPQPGHAPLFEYIDAPSGPSESSHTCRSWQPGVGPNVCNSARQDPTRGLMQQLQLQARSSCLLGSPGHRNPPIAMA